MQPSAGCRGGHPGCPSESYRLPWPPHEVRPPSGTHHPPSIAMSWRPLRVFESSWLRRCDGICAYLRDLWFAMGCHWPLATGYFLLPPGHWPLATGHWQLPAAYRPLATGYFLLATGYWLLATSYFVLATARVGESTTKVGYRPADQISTFDVWISRTMTGRRGGCKWLRHGKYANGRFGRC